MIIDRFEKHLAIIELEDQSFLQIPRKLLPSDAKEGDVLKFIIDEKQTKKRKAKIKELMEDLWE